MSNYKISTRSYVPKARTGEMSNPYISDAVNSIKVSSTTSSGGGGGSFDTTNLLKLKSDTEQTIDSSLVVTKDFKALSIYEDGVKLVDKYVKHNTPDTSLLQHIYGDLFIHGNIHSSSDIIAFSNGEAGGIAPSIPIATYNTTGVVKVDSNTMNVDENGLISVKGDAFSFTNYYTKSEVDTYINAKANSATTLAGYGITDAMTTSQINTAISQAKADIVNSAPATLDTLNELSVALGNDPNFATTVSNLIGTKAPIDNPNFTGTPKINNNTIIHSGNIASQSVNYASSAGNSTTTSQRTFGNVRTDGINRGGYGTVSITGTNNGYAGIDFTDVNATFMIRTDGLNGVYKNNSTWSWYFDENGKLVVGTVPWGNVSGRPTTISGYGITDAITTGNIGSQSVSYASSAGSTPTLSSVGNQTAISGTTRHPSGMRLAGIYANGYPFSYGNTIQIQGGLFGSELAFNCLGGGGATGTGSMIFRTQSDWGNSEWGAWKTIIDSTNIGSQSVNYAASAGSANSVTWANVSSKPSSLSTGDAGTLRISTGTGYADIGSQNYEWFHFQTDRPAFYMNKALAVDGVIRVYNTDYYISNGAAQLGRIRARVSGVSLGSGNSAQLEINNAGSGACNISFHREGVYGAHFGLDTDNWFSTYGWSAGSAYTGMRVGNLLANGYITATGDVTAYSDIKLKDNLQLIKNVLPKLDNINAYTYNRNDLNNKEELGLIAQEVEKEFPLLVCTNDNGIKSLNYQKVTTILLQAVKELNNEIHNLKDEINEIKYERSKIKK